MAEPDDHDPGLFAPPDIAAQARMVEALLFASAQPQSLRDLAARLPYGSDPAEALVLLAQLYAGRGVELVRVAGAWALRTAPDLAFLQRRDAPELRKLSRAATETLAIIAYHQPVTRAEIEEVRGVTVSRGTVDQLLDMGWIRFGRRKLTPGRPVTFVVTEVFLEHFGLDSTTDLPGLKDLRAAGLLDNRPPPGGAFALGGEDAPDDAPDDAPEIADDPGQGEMFGD